METLNTGLHPLAFTALVTLGGLLIGGVIDRLADTRGGPIAALGLGGFVVGMFLAGVLSQDLTNKATDAFEEHYDVRIIDGEIPLYDSGPEVLEVYFEDDGEIRACTVVIVDRHYEGFCEGGRDL